MVGITFGSSTRKKRPVKRDDNNSDDNNKNNNYNCNNNKVVVMVMMMMIVVVVVMMMIMMMMIMSKRPPMPYFKYEPQSMLENPNYKLYYDMSIMTDQTIHYNRQDIVILDRPIKETYLTDVAISNSHNPDRTITEKPQKYADLKEEVIRIWQLKMVYKVPLVLSIICYIPNKINENLKLLNLSPAVYILMQKAVILDTCYIVRNSLAEW